MMPRSCWILVSVCVWWLPLMLAGAQDQQGDDGCSGSPKKCGNHTISPPFWLRETDAQRPCGTSDFETSCRNNSLVLKSSIPFSFGFAIMDISYDDQSLHVVDLGKLWLLQASNSYGWPIYNTSEKLGVPFRIDPVSLSLIMYNCTEAAPRDGAVMETSMRCGNESEVLVRAYAGDAIDGCEAFVLPVMGSSSSGEVNASDYKRLIGDGFLLTWHLPVPGLQN